MFIINRTYTISISKTIDKLILIVFMLTPIFTVQESITFLFGGIESQIQNLTPVYIKLIKDLSFIILIILSLIYTLKKKKISKLNIFIYMYLFLVIVNALIFHDKIFIFFAGIRWIIPFLLIFSLIPFITRELLSKIVHIVFYLLLLHFFMQIIQLFYASDWFGINELGLSARNPGLFFIPSTAAFFTILILFLHMFYSESLRKKMIVSIIAPISILLTASGSGVVIYLVLVIIFYTKKRYYKLLPLFGIILFIFAMFFLENVVNRPNFINISFGTRVQIFLELFINGNFFSSNLGYATNAGVLLGCLYKTNLNAFITDSTYASILSNLGLISFFIIFIYILLATFVLWLKKDTERFIFLIIISLFMSTTIIFEAFPMNLLFSILTAYYLKNFKREKNEIVNNPQ